MGDESNGWGEYKRHVLSELHSLNERIERLDGKLDRVREDVITLKVKAGIWGFVAGFIPSLATVAAHLIRKLP